MSELRVLSVDGMKPALKILAPDMEAYTGRRLKLTLQSETSKGLVEQIMRGDAFDVVLLTDHVVDDLIRKEKVVADSRVELCWCGLGIGVRAGAPKPDISTPDAAKHALLNAKSISYHATGVTADLNHQLFERLGIMDALKPKLMPDSVSRGGAQKKVAEGKVEMVILLSPEVNDFEPSVEFVGQLPAVLQTGYISFVGGISANSNDPAKAKAFLQFFATPAAAPTLNALGLYRGNKPAFRKTRNDSWEGQDENAT